MSSKWQDRRRFRGGTKPSPSLAFLFLASIVLLMMEPCCGSAIRGVTVSTEESNGNGNGNASYADRRRVLANDDGDENNGIGKGETNPETGSAEGENNKDQDTDMDTGGQNPSDDIDSFFADMGLSESETNCMTDSAKIARDHPELEAAIEEYEGSSDTDINAIALSLTMKFSSNAVDKLRSVCTDSTIGGYFSDIKKAEFDCSMMGEEFDVSITNMANCLADTDECRNFNALLLMEDLWQSMGLTCIETNPEADSAEGENNKDQDTDMDTGAGKNPSDDIDSEMADIFADMGLSEPETNCMIDSAKIARDHPELEAAIEEYEGSSDMDNNDSSLTMKYSSNAADKLRSVCTDSTIGGYFSDIEKAEFDCSMMGEELGVSMTNIANCLANTDECRSFNPLLLMEELWQSMGLTCIEPDADGTEQHSSSSAPHQNNNNNKNNNNLSSELKNESSSSSPNELPQSFTTAAIILGVVAALGFFGFYRYRASSGRERTVPSAYEMTDITDLGSKSFT